MLHILEIGVCIWIKDVVGLPGAGGVIMVHPVIKVLRYDQGGAHMVIYAQIAL